MNEWVIPSRLTRSEVVGVAFIDQELSRFLQRDWISAPIHTIAEFQWEQITTHLHAAERPTELARLHVLHARFDDVRRA